MKIRSDIDSGNIEAVNLDDPKNVRLTIRPDNNHPNHFQWFNFHFDAPLGHYVLNIENASKASFPGWNEYDFPYQATASYDGINWFRVPTTYDNEKLSIDLDLTSNSIQLAFFPPFSYAKHLQLIELAKKIPDCLISSLGKTTEGRDITLLTIGNPAPHKKRCWFIARQHPGETMAEWFMEGLIERLQQDELKLLLDNAVLYLVPNMNPDGTYHGNLRTNASGTDLNRAWLDADLIKSPEVYYVRKAMHHIGVDFFMDVHGDENIPGVFLEGRLGCPTLHPEIDTLEKEFMQIYAATNSTIQDELRYEPNEPGKADLRLANSFVAEQHNCVSLLIEIPFKDDKRNPKPKTGFTIDDCKKLGRDVLVPLQHVLSRLTSQPKSEKLKSPRLFSIVSEKINPNDTEMKTETPRVTS